MLLFYKNTVTTTTAIRQRFRAMSTTTTRTLTTTTTARMSAIVSSMLQQHQQQRQYRGCTTNSVGVIMRRNLSAMNSNDDNNNINANGIKSDNDTTDRTKNTPPTNSTSNNNNSNNNNTSIYGRLWGRGYEVLRDRLIVRIHGPGATQYIQNLVTSNVVTLGSTDIDDTSMIPKPEDIGQNNNNDDGTIPKVIFNTKQLQATCFLDPKGRIITDALLWKLSDSEYYIDFPNHSPTHSTSNADDGTGNGMINTSTSTATSTPMIVQHLRQYKLRKTQITMEQYDTSDINSVVQSHVIYGTLDSGAEGCPPGYVTGLDPRHPSLGLRILQLPEAQQNGLPPLSELLAEQFGASMEGNYALLRRLAGVAEGYELTGRIALETNQELLNAISFHKGCYLGQELTARVYHTGVIRKRVVPIVLLEATSPIPQPWILAHQLQEQRLAKKYTEFELRALPSRLPRLSVAAAGQLVAVSTASIVEPTTTTATTTTTTTTATTTNHASKSTIHPDAAAELAAAQAKVTEWLQNEVEVACQLVSNDESGTKKEGAKIMDNDTGITIGQIVAPPVKGTNIVLALMRLESLGLLHSSSSPTTWNKTNKISIQGKLFRYLPYLPLWWPEISYTTGKAKHDDEDYSIEARIPDDDEISNNNPFSSDMKHPLSGTTSISIEEYKIDDTIK